MELDEYLTMTHSPRSKYGNKHVRADGYLFDSQAEYRRYNELKLLLAAGEISDLVVHPTFALNPLGNDPWTGKKIRPRRYEGDFQYYDPLVKHTVVEDVKGTRTELFNTKWDIVRLHYPEIEFRLVKA